MVDTMSNITTLGTSVVEGAQNIVTQTINFIPNLIAAIVIFVIGWVIAVVVARILGKILKIIKLEGFITKHKLGDALGKVAVSDVLVKLLKYYILIVFLQIAVSLLNLGTLTDFLTSLLIYAPVVIGGALLVVVATLVGELVKDKILSFDSKAPTLKFLGSASKLIIIFLGIISALETIGFDTTIITASFVTILQGAIFGIALAIAIAFGLGGQKDAADLIKTARKKLKF